MMAEIWEMEFGCQWNEPAYRYECPTPKCPHHWKPAFPGPDMAPSHDSSCPVGKKLAFRRQIMSMEVVVDEQVRPEEIRVSDPVIAQWLSEIIRQSYLGMR